MEEDIIEGITDVDQKKGMPSFEMYKTMDRQEFLNLVSPNLTSYQKEYFSNNLVNYEDYESFYASLRMGPDVKTFKNICENLSDPNFKVKIDQQFWDNICYLDSFLIFKKLNLILPGYSDNDFFSIDVAKVSDELDKPNSQIIIVVKQSKEDFIIQMMNKKHAALISGSRFFIMYEVTDPIFNRPDLVLMKKEDFRSKYENRLVRNPMWKKDKRQKLKITYADAWLRSTDRREYDGIVFSPKKAVPGFYNLYRGFSVEPKKGDWSLLKNHIRNVVCDNNQTLFDYVMTWKARIVQDSGGKRPGTALVFRGKQGSGKGCYLDNFGKIFGSHYLHITNKNQVTGRFNQHLKDAIFLFADEGSFTNNRTDQGILRGLITEETNMIEAKFKDAIQVRSHINVAMASNHDWIVPAGNDERRFCVIDVSASKIDDTAYFDAIYKQMDSGGREAMLYDLLHWDISKVNLRKIPYTSALLDQIVSGLSAVHKFWLDCLYKGEIIVEAKNVAYRLHESEIEIFLHELQSSYQEFCLLHRDDKILITREFARRIAQFCPSITTRKVRPDPKKRNEYIYLKVLPCLTQCREEFSKFIGKDISWD